MVDLGLERGRGNPSVTKHLGYLGERGAAAQHLSSSGVAERCAPKLPRPARSLAARTTSLTPSEESPRSGADARKNTSRSGRLGRRDGSAGAGRLLQECVTWIGFIPRVSCQG